MAAILCQQDLGLSEQLAEQVLMKTQPQHSEPQPSLPKDDLSPRQEGRLGLRRSLAATPYQRSAQPVPAIDGSRETLLLIPEDNLCGGGSLARGNTRVPGHGAD